MDLFLLCFNKCGESPFRPSVIESLNYKNFQIWQSWQFWQSISLCFSKRNVVLWNGKKRTLLQRTTWQLRQPEHKMKLQHSVNGGRQKRKYILKGASCNLFSIKLLINTRVVLGSLSTLPHLQKIKDARFPCHCLSIKREHFLNGVTLARCG